MYTDLAKGGQFLTATKKRLLASTTVTVSVGSAGVFASPE